MGVVKCVLGIFILTHAGTLLTMLTYIFSIFVLMGGFHSIEGAMQLRKAGIPGWGANAILSAVIIGAGVFMLFFPFSAIDTAILVVGVILVIDGATELFTSFQMKKLEDYNR